MFVFVLSTAVAVALSVMLAWQLYLVLTSQTTIEFYFNRYKAQQARKKGRTYNNPYNLGLLENWLYFFGIKREPYWWFIWLLPNHKMGGDGITFPTRGDVADNFSSHADFDLDAVIEEATASVNSRPKKRAAGLAHYV